MVGEGNFIMHILSTFNTTPLTGTLIEILDDSTDGIEKTGHSLYSGDGLCYSLFYCTYVSLILQGKGRYEMRDGSWWRRRINSPMIGEGDDFWGRFS